MKRKGLIYFLLFSTFAVGIYLLLTQDVPKFEGTVAPSPETSLQKPEVSSHVLDPFSNLILQLIVMISVALLAGGVTLFRLEL